MDAALFTKMLSDKSVLDLKKLGYKYPQADICLLYTSDAADE